MKKISSIVMVVAVSVACAGVAQADSIAIIKQGLLGAGTGAAATAASGSTGDGVWKGALVGMGVNVVGGALLDIITTPNGTRTVVYADEPQPVRQRYVAQRPVEYRPAYTPQPDMRHRAREAAQRRHYQAGFNDGYRVGYSDGYEDAIADTGYTYRQAR